MKAGHDQTQTNKLHDRHKSSIDRALSCNRSIKGYRQKQVCATAAKRSEEIRSAATKPPWIAEQAAFLLKLQLSPAQIAGKLIVSHEALHQHVYSNKARSGMLRKNIRFQKQASGRYRWGQILHKRPLSDCSAHIEARKQVGHRECDTVNDANQKGEHCDDGRGHERLRGHSRCRSHDIRVGQHGHCSRAPALCLPGENADLRQQSRICCAHSN